MSRRALVVFFVVVAAVGCGGGNRSDRADDDDAAAPAAALRDDGELFIMATPRVAERPVASRFGGPLPRTRADLDGEPAGPPVPYLRRRIVDGDVTIRARVLAALRAASATELADPAGELRWYYLGLLDRIGSCAWTRELLAGDESAAVRDVLAEATAYCGDHASLEALLAADAAPTWIVRAASVATLDDDGLDERLLPALRAEARTGQLDDVRNIGVLLAGLDAARVTREVAALRRRIRNPARRAAIEAGLVLHASPVIQAVGWRACAHPSVASDSLCAPDDEEPAPAPEADEPLDERVTYEPAAALLDHASRDAVIAALRRCVTTGHERAPYCFRQLAALDRADARALAATLVLPADAPPWLRVPVRTVLAFRDGAALDRQLVAMRFPLDPPGPDDDDPLIAEDVLLTRGRSTWFYLAHDRDPAEHDDLLADLAERVAPALDGVVFEELVPVTETGLYTLRAYADGKRYELDANHGDRYDVDAVVGLLNTLLRARASDQRMLLVPYSETAVVVIGPAGALRTLVDEGLLAVSGYD